VAEQITLREYDFLHSKEERNENYISRKNFEAIENFILSNEQTIPYLKIITKKGYGKLNIKEQIARNSIHKERFFVAYDEYVSDRVENRLIKTILHYLYTKSKLNSNKKRIREYLFVFDEVGVSHTVKTDFSKVKSERQMKDYEQIPIWAKTFLLGSSYSPHKGNDLAFALLFDMNVLFESYVGHFFKKRGYEVSLQDKQHHLAFSGQRGIYALRPDIVIEKGRIIADTKWKILSQEKTRQGISGSDLYQMYAYGTKYKNCEGMHLIYPKDKELEAKSYHYHKEGGLPLRILFFDLSQENGEAFSPNLGLQEDAS